MPLISERMDVLSEKNRSILKSGRIGGDIIYKFTPLIRLQFQKG